MPSWHLNEHGLLHNGALAAIVVLCVLLTFAWWLGSGVRFRRGAGHSGVRPSLRNTLLFGLCLISTMPMISLVVVLADRVAHAQEGRDSGRLWSHAIAIAGATEQFLDKHIAGIRSVAAALENPQRRDADQLYESLGTSNAVYSDFLTMLVTDRSGRVLAASRLVDGQPIRAQFEGHDVSDRPYFREAMRSGQPFVSQAFRGRGLGSDAIVAISAPIPGAGSGPRGIVEGSLDLSAFARLKSAFRLGEFSALVLDADERIVYSSFGDGYRVLDRLASDDPVREALIPAAKSESAGKASRIGDHLVARATTRQGWQVLLRLPLAPVMASIRDGYEIAWSWLAATVLISALLALAIARCVTLPLDELHTAIEAVRPGVSGASIEPSGQVPREIAMVFDHVNEMEQRLRSTNDRLMAALTAEAAAHEALEGELREREAIIEEKTRDLRIANDELKRLASTDNLTGLSNRRAFGEAVEKRWRAAVRDDKPVAIIMTDIDYFKRFNDEYGHPAGDACLRRVAAILRESVGRPLDVVARYGGEEFVIVLVDTDLAGARLVAERIRQSVHATGIEHTGSAMGSVTVSMGVAGARPAAGGTHEHCLSIADQALYEAKACGRNLVVVAPQAPARCDLDDDMKSCA